MFPGTTRRQLILTGLTTLLTSTLLNPVSYACSPSPLKTRPRSTAEKTQEPSDTGAHKRSTSFSTRQNTFRQC